MFKPKHAKLHLRKISTLGETYIGAYQDNQVVLTDARLGFVDY